MKKFLISLIIFFVELSAFAQNAEVIKSMQKYGRVVNAIDNYYVDTVNVNKLSENAITALLKGLDPHSYYISKEEFAAMNEPLAGSFDGIGVEFLLLNDTLVVVNPISGGPSERIGILADDKIVTVDGENIAGVKITNDKVFKLLRGTRGTIVSLGIIRKNVSGILTFDVVRDKIPINSVDASYEIRPGLAYLRLGRFATTSMSEIRDIFKKFKTAPEALILDLRGNGGGVLGTAFSLADQFFDANKMIVFTTGANVPGRQEFSTSDGLFKTGKLVVLIDGSSASASEIVSGAVQDWDRGVLIGRRTYGKGLVQQQMPLGDGSYIRLTVARYHTPTGRVIQRPYEMGNSQKYAADYYKRFLDGEVYNQDSIHLPDSLKYSTLTTHRTVYGGGGIMPDIYVPIDTTYYSEYYAKLIRQGIVNKFVVNYLSNNRAKLMEKYQTFENYDRNFIVDDELLNALIAAGEEEKIPRDDEGLSRSQSMIKTYLKALLARDLWTGSEFYRVMNSKNDAAYDKAIEVIDNWSEYKNNTLGYGR